MLLECWPDDPADIGLESVLKTIGPLFEQRLYPDGALLARQGDPAKCIFFLEEGTTEIFHTMRPGRQRRLGRGGEALPLCLFKIQIQIQISKILKLRMYPCYLTPLAFLDVGSSPPADAMHCWNSRARLSLCSLE